MKKVQDIFKARYKQQERWGVTKSLYVHLLKRGKKLCIMCVFVCVCVCVCVCAMLFVVINQARGSKVNNSLEKQFLTFLMIFIYFQNNH